MSTASILASSRQTFANAFISGSCRHGDSRGGNRTRDLFSLGGEVPYPLGHRAILLIPQRPSEALRSKGMVSSPRLPFSHHLGKKCGLSQMPSSRDLAAMAIRE